MTRASTVDETLRGRVQRNRQRLAAQANDDADTYGQPKRRESSLSQGQAQAGEAHDDEQPRQHRNPDGRHPQHQRELYRRRDQHLWHCQKWIFEAPPIYSTDQECEAAARKGVDARINQRHVKGDGAAKGARRS